MWDSLFQALAWLMLASLALQVVFFVGLMLWGVWTDAIKPRLIPADEIDRAADEIIALYPDPEEEAFARHERAWWRSDGAGQTYWLRVRKAVRRRLRRV